MRIFPMDGNRRIIERLRRLYQMYDKPDLVDDYVSTGGHAYRPDLRVTVFQWINKHLNPAAGPVKDVDFETIPGADLRVFPEDKDVPPDAIDARTDETFVARADVKLPKEGEFELWKMSLLTGLRQRPFRSFPERIPAAVKGNWSLCDTGTPGQAWHLGGPILTTEAPLEVLLTTPVSGNVSAPKSGLLIVLNSDEEATDPPPDWMAPYCKGNYVRLLAPRGGKAIGSWTQKSPPNYVERAHALLGRTVDEGRVWDVAAVVRYLDEKDKMAQGWRVMGRGQAGVIAAYAALFEPSIKEVVVVDPPASHRDGPYFLGVLRVLDTPDALGLLAPRPLTLVGAKDKAFERTEQIYKAAGAAEKLRRR